MTMLVEIDIQIGANSLRKKKGTAQPVQTDRLVWFGYIDPLSRHYHQIQIFPSRRRPLAVAIRSPSRRRVQIPHSPSSVRRSCEVIKGRDPIAGISAIASQQWRPLLVSSSSVGTISPFMKLKLDPLLKYSFSFNHCVSFLFCISLDFEVYIFVFMIHVSFEFVFHK